MDALRYFAFLLFLPSSSLAVQPSAPDPIPAPIRDLKWGQLNFLHTTDTHGWLAGHLQEASYGADWGDYVSFTTRMREKAHAEGTDLLVIDTGDRVEGNGLYDSSEPKGVYVSDILRQQHIDLMSSGNHELYKQNSSETEFYTTVPNFRGNYLASNIDILHPSTKELVPLAPRFKKFTTEMQGIRIIAFGFLFDFTKNYNNTIVYTVEDTIKTSWFQEAIRDAEVDLFLVIGHVPVHSKEFSAVFKEIRKIRWDVPIQFFGGHFHIRDYARYDSRAYALASGRFMETIGFMSIDGLSTSKNRIKPAMTSPKFFRRYIDNNLFSFQHHTGLDRESFPTEHGRNVSLLIQESRTALYLDKIHGCAPRDLWMSRVKYPSEDSVYTWLEKEVLPDQVRDQSRTGKSALVVVNTGAIRFDIFKGPFTQDTTFIVSPFTSGFRYIKDIPYDKAQSVVEVLNKQPQILTGLMGQSSNLPWTLAPPEQSAFTRDRAIKANAMPARFLTDQTRFPLSALSQYEVFPGYTTLDDGGLDGDDTVHSPISFYRVPNCIQALIPPEASTHPKTVDLVYIDFIEPYVALAAKFASLDVDFSQDSDVYMPSSTLTNLILDWVKDNWKCEDA
ncbi:metallophosphoesterase family protein [Aspergillus clavatus NRRL 1]|uniref:Ser/Thr protein phosphatase family n=1 Tax=Aspergillus clavatus (strain ATCC 1007 / CBS 513.65 / DSM 816 / NCTC 3887 / NRRL 1 / QM 1276 / 107) TaxID=344612 RepID=A1CC51_ASPCL|nr:Ser/Thr protein phosphatase family [Aspergillus clavatus NRRL 1]EAW12108.1 Ser/Thr protein phosphatase family [Aspergillus clavatus NRRL 1]